MRRRKLLVLGLAVTAALVGGAVVYTHFFFAPQRSAEMLLECLPGDTETVWVTRGPFKAFVPPRNSRPFPRSLILEQWPVVSPSGLQEGTYLPHFAGRTISLAMHGSRKFRSPTGLSGFRYDGANVIQFEQAFGFEIFTLWRAIARGAKEVKKMHGIDVALLQENWESNVWTTTIFIAMPCSNVIVVGTDRAYVSDVIGALRGIKPARPVHDFFRESLHRAGDARTWIARHYDPVNTNEDPSSPLGKNVEYLELDPQARGIFVVHDPSKDPRVRISYFSTNPDALGIVSRNWSNAELRLKPAATMTVPGEVELYLPEDPALANICALLILFAVGHGVYR
jgi:hypothetical protein